jgi:hypothetical protein
MFMPPGSAFPGRRPMSTQVAEPGQSGRTNSPILKAWPRGHRQTRAAWCCWATSVSACQGVINHSAFSMYSATPFSNGSSWRQQARSQALIGRRSTIFATAPIYPPTVLRSFRTSLQPRRHGDKIYRGSTRQAGLICLRSTQQYQAAARPLPAPVVQISKPDLFTRQRPGRSNRKRLTKVIGAPGMTKMGTVIIGRFRFSFLLQAA